MHVGFTGTREGMTSDQRRAVRDILARLVTFRVAHHGDCIGADAEFHEAARLLYAIHIHPPADDRKRAFCKLRPGDTVTRPKPFLDRNRDIVHASLRMVAGPKEKVEQLHSGTWSTIRYTRRVGVPLAICWPDGTVTYERWP